MIQRLQRRLPSSYRLRLSLGYVAVIGVLAVAWLASLFGPLTTAVTAQQRSHLESVARADAIALDASPAMPVRAFAARIGSKDLRVTIVDRNGVVLADTENDPAKMENHGSRPEIAAALAGRSGQAVRKSATEGIEQMYVAVPATLSGQRVALRVSESLASVSALASAARTTGLLLLTAGILLSLFVTARLSSTAAAPVTRLAGAARALARGDLRTEVPSEDGELGVLSEALSDLAEQVRSRIAAAEAEQADLRTVLDGLEDAVLLLDDGVVTLANRATSRLFRMPFGGWRGRDLSEVGLPASIAKAIQDVSVSEEHIVRELGPDPTGRTLRLAVVPLAAADEHQRTLVVLSDVSERARLDAMRRDFVANASHELKTPTAAIQLLAESAETAADDGDVTQALTFVGQMRAEADRLRKLVLDLLDLSRLEQIGTGEAVTDAREAIALAVTSHRAAADAKSLELITDASDVEGRDVFLAVDPTDVAVALDNLLSNAITYTEAGGVTLRLGLEDGRVRIAVADTGVGIPADALPRVFERFYRVDKARSRESGGTGLGLSLVRHVAERNDGDVRIASVPGEGTTVVLTLPRAV